MPRRPTDHPNVIVFFTDQQRWDTTGVHGNPLGLTPNFDRMAMAGTHVYNAFTCQPVCGPARASLQTGRYALDTGVWRNGLALREEEHTLAHFFRDAGYTTGYIGKWHLADEDPVRESQRGGYEYWLAANVLEFCSEPYDTVMFDNDGEPVKLPGYRVDAQTDAVIRYIDDHRTEPFFLFVSYLEPHHQNRIDDFVPPSGCREPYQNRWVPPDLAALGGSTQQHLAGYYGIVKRLDEALGRMLDALQEPGSRREHDRALHVGPRLPFQDAQRGVQTIVPRKLDPGTDRGDRAGIHGGRTRSAAREPRRSAADPPGCGRDSGAALDARTLRYATAAGQPRGLA